ncbi:MAG: cyclic nucleotide-binding domain-containing protein, partial [Acidobacteriota bacterium]
IAFAVAVTGCESEGDEGAHMYIVQEGAVELFKEHAGQERSLASLEIGDFFGEMGLLEGGPRALSARATTDCKLLRLDSSTFDRILREVPEIPVRMLRKLARRLNDRLEADARAAAIAWDQKEPAGSEAETGGDGGPARLVHADSGAEFPLPGETADVTIGRPDSATGHTPDVDLGAIDSKRTLSRRHAKISRREDGFWLEEEIGTSNGTFVDGERVETGVPVRIEDGDEVRFGLVKMTFRIG